MKDNDVQLINRCIDGDDTAFAELVEKYHKQVHALVWRKIGDFHVAEEITQDTFLNAYQKLTTLKKPRQFASWLYVIATNHCSTWLRKKHLRAQLLEEKAVSQSEKANYSEHMLAENERITIETQRDVVKKLLAKLGESERTVMTLHYFGDMSCKEIGAFLGVSANTVKSRLHRAQQRLQKEEPIIREALDNFKLSPNLPDTIMREISRTKVSTPTSGKPLVPWTVAASMLAVVLLILGFGNSKYLARFQEPYSLDANAEMTVEIVDAPIVADLVSKPDIRMQIGSANALDEHNNLDIQPNDSTAAIAEAHTDEIAEDYTKWELPKAAKARLGKGGINAMKFSPDGTLLAVGSNIGIWLYDAKTGKEISLFPGICESLAFSPDGLLLANGGFGRLWSKELQLWEISTRKKISLTSAPRSATALHFSEDGKTLVSVDSWGATISRLDIETGKKNVTDLEEQPDSLGHIIEVYAFTHDKVAGGKKDGKIRLWDTTTGKKLTTLSGHARVVENKYPFDTPVLALAFLPDGTRLASGSTDTTVRLWDTTNDDEPIILREHTGWVNVLAFSPDGKVLASGSTDKTVQLWNTDTGELLSALTGHINGIAALTFSPDGTTLVSASTDGEILFWNTQTKKRLPTRISEHTEYVKAVTFLKDNTTLASVAFNDIITFWDLETSQISESQTIGQQDLLKTGVFSPDGTKLASIGAEGKVLFVGEYGSHFSKLRSDDSLRLTDIRTARELTNLKTGIFVEEIAYSPQGRAVAFSGDNAIRVWNTETGSFLNMPYPNEWNFDQYGNLVLPSGMGLSSPTPTSKIILALVFSPDGRKLVSGNYGGQIEMWDAESGVVLASFTIQNARLEQLTALSFSSNGVLFAAGSTDRIYVMGSSKLTLLREIEGGVEILVFAPDSTVLVSGLRSGGIELWDVESGDKLTTLDGHSAPVETLVFSPDGKTLVSTGQDGTILVWDWDEVLEGIKVGNK